MKRIFFAFLAFYLIYNGFIFLRVVVTNNQANEGIKLAEAQAELDRYRAENVTLRAEILEKTSLHTIDAEARAIGFSETTNDDYYNLNR